MIESLPMDTETRLTWHKPAVLRLVVVVDTNWQALKVGSFDDGEFATRSCSSVSVP